MTKDDRLNQNKQDANIKMGGTQFTTNLRAPYDPLGQFAEGDVIEFPATITDDIMGTQTFNGKPYQFIVLKITKAGGQENYINWFPSSFTRIVFEYKMDPIAKIAVRTDAQPFMPKGTAVDAFNTMRGKAEYNANGVCTKTDTQKCVEQLLGKKVKITKRELVNTVGFTNNERDLSKLVKQAVMTFDIAA